MHLNIHNVGGLTPEIACRHKIPTALVGRIIRAARKDSNYF